jgi:hypothetical protein
LRLCRRGGDTDFFSFYQREIERDFKRATGGRNDDIFGKEEMKTLEQKLDEKMVNLSPFPPSLH